MFSSHTVRCFSRWYGTQLVWSRMARWHARDTVLLLQEYIENENSRLEREGQFWAKEIIVRMEYKYCPNLSIIDTPGEALAQMQACAATHKVVFICHAATDCTPHKCASELAAALRHAAGLISAAPGKRNGQLQASARQVDFHTEWLVLKIALLLASMLPSRRACLHQCVLYI